MGIAFAISGVNGYRKVRVTRLCMHSRRSGRRHPLGRLGKFRGIRLGPKRSERMVVRLRGSSFRCFSRGEER